MHSKAICARPPRAHVLDLREQAVVLSHVLALGERRARILDLARELDARPGDFRRPAAVERAIRDLTGVGLVEIESGLVVPTAAARRFEQILESGV